MALCFGYFYCCCFALIEKDTRLQTIERIDNRLKSQHIDNECEDIRKKAKEEHTVFSTICLLLYVIMFQTDYRRCVGTIRSHSIGSFFCFEIPYYLYNCIISFKFFFLLLLFFLCIILSAKFRLNFTIFQ